MCCFFATLLVFGPRLAFLILLADRTRAGECCCS